jgi:hypothetical protein
MRLGYHTITWGGVIGAPAGVTSAKDLYYLSNGSVETAVRDIASVGYEGVEVFDGNLVAFADRPEVLTDLFAETGTELVSVYTGANFVYADVLPDEMFRIRRACELAATFGAGRLVVGGGARRAAGATDEDYDRLAAALDSVVDVAAEHGLDASYHPHLGSRTCANSWSRPAPEPSHCTADRPAPPRSSISPKREPHEATFRPAPGCPPRPDDHCAHRRPVGVLVRRWRGFRARRPGRPGRRRQG